MRKSRPDLVLLDWGLPGTPGLTFARRLRGDHRTRDVSIVMLTGRADEQDRITGLDGGADDYLVKPYSLRELMARIRAVMRRRTPQLADEVIEVRASASTRACAASPSTGARSRCGPPN